MDGRLLCRANQALLSEDELVRWAGLGPILGLITFLLFIFGRNLKGEPMK